MQQRLQGTITQVFENAVQQPTFVAMYADFCSELDAVGASPLLLVMHCSCHLGIKALQARRASQQCRDSSGLPPHIILHSTQQSVPLLWGAGAAGVPGSPYPTPPHPTPGLFTYCHPSPGAQALPEFPAPGEERVSFKKLLANTCQEEYEATEEARAVRFARCAVLHAVPACCGQPAGLKWFVTVGKVFENSQSWAQWGRASPAVALPRLPSYAAARCACCAAAQRVRTMSSGEREDAERRVKQRVLGNIRLIRCVHTRVRVNFEVGRNVHIVLCCRAGGGAMVCWGLL